MLILLKIETMLMLIGLVVSAIAFIEKREAIRLSLFILLLYLSFINSVRVFQLIHFSPSQNFILTNVTMFIEILFYLLIFYFSLRGRTQKKIIKWFFVVFIFSTIMNNVFIQPIDTNYSNYSFILGSVFVLFSILFFFREQLSGDGYRTIFKNYWFWYAAALFVFLASEIPIISIVNYQLQSKCDISVAIYIFNMKIFTGYLYYLSFSVAYLLCRNKT